VLHVVVVNVGRGGIHGAVAQGGRRHGPVVAPARVQVCGHGVGRFVHACGCGFVKRGREIWRGGRQNTCRGSCSSSSSCSSGRCCRSESAPPLTFHHPLTIQAAAVEHDPQERRVPGRRRDSRVVLASEVKVVVPLGRIWEGGRGRTRSAEVCEGGSCGCRGKWCGPH
jgi:hypothetical protein